MKPAIVQDAVQHAIQGAVWHTAQQNGSKAAMTTTQGAPTARLSEGMWLCGRRVSCAAAVPEQRSDGVGRPPRRRYRALGPTNAPRIQLQPLHCSLWTRRCVLGTGRDAVLSLHSVPEGGPSVLPSAPAQAATSSVHGRATMQTWRLRATAPCCVRLELKGTRMARKAGSLAQRRGEATAAIAKRLIECLHR